ADWFDSQSGWTCAHISTWSPRILASSHRWRTTKRPVAPFGRNGPASFGGIEMRYVSFEVETALGAQQRAGVLTAADTIVDLNLAYRLTLEDEVGPARASALADAILPPNLLSILANGW